MFRAVLLCVQKTLYYYEKVTTAGKPSARTPEESLVILVVLCAVTLSVGQDLDAALVIRILTQTGR